MTRVVIAKGPAERSPLMPWGALGANDGTPLNPHKPTSERIALAADRAWLRTAAAIIGREPELHRSRLRSIRRGPLWSPCLRREIERLQRELRDQGFDPGPIDGIMGIRTKEAMRARARSRGALKVPP